MPPALHISLPYENQSEYSKVLQQLERRQRELGINSISISDASLEDVFLKYVSDFVKLFKLLDTINCSK